MNSTLRVRSRLRCLLVLAAFIYGSPGVLLAQAQPLAQTQAQTAHEVSGVVRNDAGGAIAGATVTITDPQGAHTSAVSDQDGRYRLTVPNAGAGAMSVEAAGFAPTVRAVQIPASGPVTLDATLSVAVSEQVVVGSSLTGVSLESSQNLSAITLTGSSLNSLPNDPESLLSTLRLLAGTTGTRADQVAIYVNGMPLDRRLPPKDVIQSIRINANPFSAEFAEPGPSRIEILTKPASQSFHGEGRFDFNDARLNARNPFEPVRAPMQIRSYVGYAGGPIVRNRWGVVLYGGWWDQDENAVVNVTTVDPATLLSTPLQLNVRTPRRTRSYALKTDALATRRHMLALEVARDEERRPNAGLQGGFDLPERAYNSTSTEESASLMVNSTFSDHLLNELHVRVSRSQQRQQALTNAPALMVLEAFNGGGSQDSFFKDYTTNTQLLTNVTTLAAGQHAIRFGVQGQLDRLTQVDRSNFNGAFIFGSDVARDAEGNPVIGPDGETPISAIDLYRLTLAGTPGYRPSQFSIVRGDPSAAFRVPTGAAFVQDDWRVSPKVTLSYGVRADFQDRLRSPLTLAPRAGVAWAPGADGRSALRVGVGLFRSPVPNTVYSDVVRLDGQHGQQFVINQPSFFPLVPATLPDAESLLAAIRTQAPGLSAPSALVSTISYDRQLTAHLSASIGYTWRRGIDLLRTRVLSDGNERPAGPVLQYESTGRSTAHEIHATASGSLGSHVTLFGGYEWAHALQDTDSATTAPADSRNLGAEWGLAPIPRQQASLGANVELPGQFSLNSMIQAASALPFNITTGRDNNGDTLFFDRPAFAQAGDPGAVVTSYGIFNPNPLPGQALVPRNFALGPRQLTVDLTVARTFMLGTGDGQSRKMTLYLIVNNLGNHNNFAPFNGVLTSPFFGAANTALNPRRITLSGRYTF